jgi:peptidoglycan/LPS O-acetylase OafA/YrhL
VPPVSAPGTVARDLTDPAPSARRPTLRIPELDALRGIAAVSVLLYHFVSSHHDLCDHAFPNPRFLDFGGYGVHLFFIISGFVILMTLERTARPLDFVIARFARLFPTYWAAVLFTSAVLAAGGVPGRTVSGPQVLANLTMVQHFLGIPDVDGNYWTLACELAFYVVMLLVRWARLMDRIEQIGALWIGFAFGYFLAHRAGLVTFGHRTHTILLLDYCHLFVAGMMFYRLRALGHGWQRHLILAGVAAYELAIGTTESLVVVMVLLAIFYGAAYGKLSWLAVRPLLFLGSISYALYLTHGWAGHALLLALGRRGLNPVPALTIAIVAFVLLAWAITRLVEQPALRWIKTRARRHDRPALGGAARG